MTIAQDLIEAAYDRSTANDPGKLAQDAELLGHLNRTWLRYYALLMRARPNLGTTRTFLTLLGNPATAVMSPAPIELRHVFNADEKEVNVIDNTERELTTHFAPCIYREGARLTSRAHGGDPISCDILELTVIDTPLSLTALNTALDPRFPERHHQLLIDSLAIYLDVKDEDRDADKHGQLVEEYTKALGAFANEYGLAPEALQWAHAPVKRKRVNDA